MRIDKSSYIAFLLIVVVLFGCKMISQTREGIQAIYGSAAAAGVLHYYASHGSLSSLPTSVLFQPGKIGSRDAFKDWASSALSISLDSPVEVSGLRGRQHVRYQQLYKGLPVEGAVYTAHFQGGDVWSATGLVYQDISLNTRPGASIEETVESLQERYPTWRVMDETTLVVLPRAAESGSEFSLAYRTGILESSSGMAYKVYTDADDVSILRVEPLMHPFIATGSGTTSNGETVSFETQHTDDIPVDTSGIVIEDIRTGYRLMDVDRNLHTKSAGGSSMGDEYRFDPQDDGTTRWTGWNFSIMSHDLIEDDNVWENDAAAVDVHWGMQIAYDYFKDVHNRVGYDGNNGYFLGVVDYDRGMENAFFFKYLPGVLFGDGGSFGRSMTVLDVVAHEYTHAVETSIANLNYFEEAGSLKEGIADVFMTDLKFRMGRGNWLLAPQLVGARARNFEDPHASESPDTFEGRYFGEYSTEYGRGLGLQDMQQHQNSTILSHWFYLLSEGGEGENDNEDYYDIEPLEREKVIEVVYESLFMLHPNATFKDMRDATTSIIQREFGKCSDELKQMTNAWNAVGVGDPFCDCFEGSFTGVFETDEGPAEMKYFFKGDKYAVEVEDSNGIPRVVYTSSTDPYRHVQGVEDPIPTSPEEAIIKRMFLGKVPLVVQPQPYFTRKEYIEYRNSKRTGNYRQEGDYRVYEHRLEEATIWATEEVCLSWGDLAATILTTSGSSRDNMRQLFFGFPTEFSIPGEGSVRVINLREHDVPDSYFRG